MRKPRWMEYLEDYDFSLHYHPSKENVMANALSRKPQGVLAMWFPEIGKCLRLWDSSCYTTRVKLKVLWGV